MTECLERRGSAAPEWLAAFEECLFAGEAYVAEQPPFLGELTQGSPLAAADDPGRNGVEARAQHRRACLEESGIPWGPASQDRFLEYLSAHGVAPDAASLVVSVRDGADQ